MSTAVRKKWPTLLITLLAPLTAAWACTDSGTDEVSGPDDDPAPPQSGVVEVDLVNFAFDRSEIRIEAGTTVRWTNTTTTFHTVTPDGHDQFQQFQFPAGDVGVTFEVTFDEAGSYDYFCVPHRSAGMVGTVIVE